MIETLISSKTRIKLLLKFFLNTNSRAYLRGLETELGESTNAIRLELNKFESAGLLTYENVGNKKIFSANRSHPLFNDIHNIVLKHTGIDSIIENVIAGLGNVRRLYLTGSFARGLDDKIISLIIVGDPDREYLSALCAKAEKVIDKKISYSIFEIEEYNEFSSATEAQERLLLWSENVNE